MKQQPYSNQTNGYNPNHPNHPNLLNYGPTNPSNPANPINPILQSNRHSPNYQVGNQNTQHRSRNQYQGPIQQVSAYPPMNPNSNNHSGSVSNIHHTMPNVSRAQPALHQNPQPNLISHPTLNNQTLASGGIHTGPLISTGGHIGGLIGASGHAGSNIGSGFPTGQHQTGQHQSGQHQAGQHQTGQHQTGQHQTGQHQTGQHQTVQPSIRKIHTVTHDSNLDDDIDSNIQEIKKMKGFIEKVHIARFEIDDILKTIRKNNDLNLPKSVEDNLLRCESYRNEILGLATKSLLLNINPYQEENEITINKDQYPIIENELARLKKRDSVEYYGILISGLRQYFSTVLPNLYEFYARTKYVAFIPFFELQLHQLKITLTKVSNRQHNLVFLCFEPDWKYKELDDMFYVSIIQPDLLTLTLTFKKTHQSSNKFNSFQQQNDANKNLSNDETVVLHSFTISTLFEGSKTLKGLKNKNNKKYYIPNMFNNFSDKVPEDLMKLRELIMNNYDRIDLPCLYPRTKLLQYLTLALNNKYLTYNDTTLYSRNKELSTMIEETLKYCNIFNLKCAICQEKIQLDFRDLLMPILMRDKNEKYSHLGCWKSNLKSMASALSIEIPLTSVDEYIGGNDHQKYQNDL